MARKKPPFGPLVDVYAESGPPQAEQLGKVLRLIVEAPLPAGRPVEREREQSEALAPAA